MQQSKRVLATGEAQQQSVPVLNHAPIFDGLPHRLHDLFVGQMYHRLDFYCTHRGVCEERVLVGAARPTEDLAVAICIRENNDESRN